MPTAPKDPLLNARYRREIIDLGNKSKEARRDIITAASRDVVWFVDTFLYGYNPKDHPSAPERPFVTYPFQEKAIRRIEKAIGYHDLVVPKSRAVGGTYMILATLFHRWLFFPMQSFLLASAKEDRVDNSGDPSCLFWKMDNFLQNLPSWMKPLTDRIELKLENLETGSVINGESTNNNIDRGGRRTVVLADEAAAMREAAKIASSIQYVTNCCIWLSTFQGASGGFYELYKKYSQQQPDWVIKLGWWDHPIYSEGLYYGPDGKPRSPWYDRQCLRAVGPRWIAQELDMDAMASGGQFFENELIDRLLGKDGTIRTPVSKGEVRFEEAGENPRFTPEPHGHLYLWCVLDRNGQPPPGTYVMGLDIATGKGGEMSSASTICVVDINTGEKVAEYKNSLITPTNFAKVVTAIARYFYEAKLIFGSQGLGDFQATLRRECKYHRVHSRKDGKWGFAENPESKLELLGNYRDALATGRFINRSSQALEECRQFIYANNTVEHSQAIQRDQDPENSGKLHGDIVVADAMACYILPLPSARVQARPQAIPGTFAWRLAEAERRFRQGQDDWADKEAVTW